LGDLATYAGLFTAALVAATVLPAQSELLLAALVLAERYPLWLLVLVASVGNTLGSTINWSLGRLLSRFEKQRWSPIRREAIAGAEAWYHRWGRWSLLLSWLPVIGDPLTIVAGVLREPLPIFLLLVAIAKTARYLAVVAITQGWM
jgi:membrane protein YqaA with SNARE-associated domain